MLGVCRHNDELAEASEVLEHGSLSFEGSAVDTPRRPHEI